MTNFGNSSYKLNPSVLNDNSYIQNLTTIKFTAEESLY